MGLGDVSLVCAAALVDELAMGGVRHATVSPGSRSTALSLALERDPRIAVHVHLDERSAAFFALGIAKTGGTPVAVACTSGTAAAELFPAVVEAERSRTPLVLLTADRPPRLRGTGANQTIDQVRLYGSHARAYLEPPVPASDGDAAAWRAAGRDAMASALGPVPGPVQVNCSFEEPLVPELPAADEAVFSMNAPAPAEPDADDVGAVDAEIDRLFEEFGPRRGLVTIGSLPHPRSLALLSMARLLGWPVLAEPLSGLRLRASGAGGAALAAGQFLIGDDDWMGRSSPEVLLQIGAAPTTRATQTLAARVPELVVLDRRHPDPDPAGRAAWRIRRDPQTFADRAWTRFAEAAPPDPAWLEGWHAADLATRRAVDEVLDRDDEPWEGRLARDLASGLPAGAVLVVGSSMPVRDLDSFMRPRHVPRIWNPGDLLRVVANRGASGIDGTVATALGAAAAGRGPAFALIGDLTFLHDVGSLLWAGPGGGDLVLVVARNGEGTIFSFLSSADLPEREVRRLFTTPHTVDLEKVCTAAGAMHRPVHRASDLAPELARASAAGGVHVLDVSVDPDVNRVRHAEAGDAAARALGRLE